jgi:hypothetical protein
MWSDQFENTNDEESGQQLPAFQEKAWDKMLPLLDEHLPQKKKRRWPLLFILMALLAGGAGILMLQKNKQEIVDDSSIKRDNPSITKDAATLQQSKNTNTPGGDGETHQQLIDSGGTGETLHEHLPSAEVYNTQAIKPRNERQDTKFYTQTSRIRTILTSGGSIQRNNSDATVGKVTQSNTNSDTPETESLVVEKIEPSANALQKNNSGNTADTTFENTTSTVVVSEKILDTAATIPKIDSSAVIAKKKIPSNKSSRFSAGISFGPDISSIGLTNTGKLKMQAGITLGYDINSHLTIRTGLLVSRKIYTADSADYHPPANFWSYYPNLQNIRANCLIYEIPLNIAYTFNQNNKHNWFISAGLSSYLMKKETYVYDYKNTWGQNETYTRNYSNENSHFFSVLGLSGGYKYNFTSRFSLTAEPYVRIPFAGVGFGKVKLNSAGVLITAALRPFEKNK